jgi:hypothetical protein
VRALCGRRRGLPRRGRVFGAEGHAASFPRNGFVAFEGGDGVGVHDRVPLGAKKRGIEPVVGPAFERGFDAGAQVVAGGRSEGLARREGQAGGDGVEVADVDAAAGAVAREQELEAMRETNGEGF